MLEIKTKAKSLDFWIILYCVWLALRLILPMPPTLDIFITSLGLLLLVGFGLNARVDDLADNIADLATQHNLQLSHRNPLDGCWVFVPRPNCTLDDRRAFCDEAKARLNTDVIIRTNETIDR